MEAGEPAPCQSVVLAGGRDSGYVVLKDRVGVAQYLVMPTVLIAGIEDSRLLRTDAPNYFAPAWAVRRLVATRLGFVPARDDIAIAINSRYGRSQDLLHLHVDCLRQDVRDSLRRAGAGIGEHWARHPLTLASHPYCVRRVDGDERPAANPFRLLATGLHIPIADMGSWTLLLAGAEFAGRPDFILLAARADPARGIDGSAEELMDHDCRRDR